jgi:3-hydroxyisobutyrate dehydrogenase-like beta-hydroxyacid dehydrogenase
MTRIAFFGLGAMGSRMAANLVKAGFAVAVWNRSLEKAAALSQAGAQPAASPADAAKDADIVFSMVTDDAAARAVWFGQSGALSAMRPGAVAVEMSTVSPGWISELHAATGKAGIGFLDAPVAGSRPQAEAGQLIVMAGGDSGTLERVRPAFAPMAATVIHAGKAGSGAVLKLAVNAFFGVQIAAMAELLGVLARNGFTLAQAAEMMAQFPVVAAPLAGSAKMMAAGNTTPMFTIELIAKDLGYASALAGAEASPMVDAAGLVARRAIAAGHGAANVTGFAKLYLG